MAKFIDLWHHRPARWGVIYIVSMALFAIVYSFLPRDFVQSTIKDDPRFERVETELFELASTALNDLVGRPLGEDNPMTYMSVGSDIQRFNDRSVLLPGSYFDSGDLVDLEFHIGAVSSGVILRARRPDSRSAIDWRAVSKFSTIADFEAAGIVVDFYTSEDDHVHTLLLPDQAALKARVIEWTGAQDSYVSSSGNGFIRMIYFSVVTATTLGYGDIVPVSDRARILVSIQTVFSVICIGLFLNAVAAGRQKSA